MNTVAEFVCDAIFQFPLAEVRLCSWNCFISSACRICTGNVAQFLYINSSTRLIPIDMKTPSRFNFEYFVCLGKVKNRFFFWLHTHREFLQLIPESYKRRKVGKKQEIKLFGERSLHVYEWESFSFSKTWAKMATGESNPARIKINNHWRRLRIYISSTHGIANLLSANWAERHLWKMRSIADLTSWRSISYITRISAASKGERNIWKREHLWRKKKASLEERTVWKSITGKYRLLSSSIFQ